jgi:hypothetical protein
MTPRRFFVDRFQISFLKLRILTFPFSKDANWIIGAFHGCSPRIGMERTILQDDKKNWASARPSYSRHFDTCRSVDKRSSSQPGRNQAANCKTLLIRTFLDVPDINLIWHIGCCSMMRNAITEVRTILSTRPEDSESQSGRSATAARERQRHLLIPRSAGPSLLLVFPSSISPDRESAYVFITAFLCRAVDSWVASG